MARAAAGQNGSRGRAAQMRRTGARPRMGRISTCGQACAMARPGITATPRPSCAWQKRQVVVRRSASISMAGALRCYDKLGAHRRLEAIDRALLLACSRPSRKGPYPRLRRAHLSLAPVIAAGGRTVNGGSRAVTPDSPCDRTSSSACWYEMTAATTATDTTASAATPAATAGDGG
jgi:hypothetical protein